MPPRRTPTNLTPPRPWSASADDISLVTLLPIAHALHLVDLIPVCPLPCISDRIFVFAVFLISDARLCPTTLHTSHTARPPLTQMPVTAGDAGVVPAEPPALCLLTGDDLHVQNGIASPLLSVGLIVFSSVDSRLAFAFAEFSPLTTPGLKSIGYTQPILFLTFPSYASCVT